MKRRFKYKYQFKHHNPRRVFYIIHMIKATIQRRKAADLNPDLNPNLNPNPSGTVLTSYESIAIMAVAGN